MVRLLRLVLIYLVFGCATATFGQTPSMSSLGRGDTVPNVLCTINRGDSIFKFYLSIYKGKLLLLDIWGVNCANCLASMPDMLKLQNDFQDKLQIIFVTRDKNYAVKALLDKFNSKVRIPEWARAAKQLSFINGDTILTSLFPVKVQPTYVWIDSNGIVRHITYSQSVTFDNIKNYFLGGKSKLKEVEYVKLDMSNPLNWIGMYGSNMGYLSTISNHIENGGDERIIKPLLDSTSGLKTGYSCLNSTILDLYRLAFGNWMISIPDNRIVVEATERDVFYKPSNISNIEWLAKNTYCYAINLDTSRAKGLSNYIRQDLDRFFNYKSAIEKRRVECITFMEVPGRKKNMSISTVKDSSYAYFDKSKKQIVLHRVDMKLLTQYYLANLMHIKYKFTPFFDMTSYKGKINMVLPWDEDYNFVSLTKLNRALLNYGFKIIQQTKKIDMLVIKCNN